MQKKHFSLSLKKIVVQQINILQKQNVHERDFMK